METAKKHNVVVEVMALTGGHLLLPRVKLSKYFPADRRVAALASASSNHGDEASSMNCAEIVGAAGSASSTVAKLEAFAKGQVYCPTLLERVHVLPPVNSIHENRSIGDPRRTSQETDESHGFLGHGGGFLPSLLLKSTTSRNSSAYSSLSEGHKHKRSSSMSSSSMMAKQPMSLMTIIKGTVGNSLPSPSSSSMSLTSTKDGNGHTYGSNVMLATSDDRTESDLVQTFESH